jgi:glyoxylase-like metal-dependent hydrolase (beta-lactamase superfamily II)
MKIKFLGAAKTVTGSFYLIDTDKVRFAVDCGLFQGTKELKEKNYADFVVDPKSIEFLIITHAHIDHICEVDNIKKMTNAKVVIHSKDAGALGNSSVNGSALFGRMRTFGGADLLVDDGDYLDAGGIRFEIIHTPGHTPGGICIKAGNSVFTGDTLFKGSIGRTDLANGNYEDIISSIKNKLLVLDNTTEILPGHGESTSVGYERVNNPFL